MIKTGINNVRVHACVIYVFLHEYYLVADSVTADR